MNEYQKLQEENRRLRSEVARLRQENAVLRGEKQAKAPTSPPLTPRQKVDLFVVVRNARVRISGRNATSLTVRMLPTSTLPDASWPESIPCCRTIPVVSWRQISTNRPGKRTCTAFAVIAPTREYRAMSNAHGPVTAPTLGSSSQSRCRLGTPVRWALRPYHIH